MARGTYLRFVFVASLALVLCARPLSAQLPPRLERCLPNPSLAQDFAAPNETGAAAASELPLEPKVAIVSVTFAPGAHLPQSVRAAVIKEVQSPEFHDSADKSWLDELQDVGVLGALQDAGYFFAKVKADAAFIDSRPRRNRYAVTLHIEEGRRYTLGDLRFSSTTDNETLAFAETELRRRFSIKRGDIFDVSKIGAGLHELTALYNSRGYIDMTPEPTAPNAEGPDAVDLLVKIDEQKPYRIGKLDFFGLTEKAQLELRPQLKSGDIFNPSLVDQLIRQNKSLLPADVSSGDVEIRRNQTTSLVDIRFDFWTCLDQATPPH